MTMLEDAVAPAEFPPTYQATDLDGRLRRGKVGVFGFDGAVQVFLTGQWLPPEAPPEAVTVDLRGVPVRCTLDYVGDRYKRSQVVSRRVRWWGTWQ